MPDFFMTLGWFVHTLLLIAAAIYGAKALGYERKDWPFFVFVFVWCVLVLAAHLSSIMSSLNDIWVYITFSVLSVGVFYSLIRYVHAQTEPLAIAPKLSFALIEGEKEKLILTRFLQITFAIVLLLNCVIVISSNPDNADSIIYRLPRAFWYVSNGSFLHPFEAVDRRLTFYPLDGVALYVPMVLYAVPGVFYNFPSLFMWLAVVYVAYRFARDLGANRLLAGLSAWLVALTPNVLAQAISTNDEILAAAALVVGIYLFWRWMITGKRSYVFLSLLSVGLSVGTKLHIVFLLPTIIGVFLIAVWGVYKKPERLKQWGRAIGWRTSVLSLIGVLVMVVPFLFYNYASCGRFYFVDEFAKDVFNLRANLHNALQNLLIYTSQMIIAPIGDLNFWPYVEARIKFNQFLNSITNPLIMPLISQDPAFYHANYRFSGVTIPTSVRFVEFSLWGGFVWLLWPIHALLFAKDKQSFSLKPVFLLLALTPFMWLLLWSAVTLYMEGTATYFSFYLAVAAPAAIFVFLPIRRAFLNELRWVVIVFVMLSNLIIVGNIYAYSGFRSITDIVRTSRWPFDWLLFDPKVADELERAKQIRIVYTHEKMPYFSYMRFNPKAKHLNPYKAPLRLESGLLQIIPVSSIWAYGYMPIKVPGKLTTGATFIGLIRGIGREAIFGVGNDVELRYPKENNYIIPQVIMQGSPNGYAVGIPSPDVMGFNAYDNLEFLLEIRRGNQDEVIYKRDWEKTLNFVAFLEHNPNEFPHSLTIKVRSAWNHKELTVRTYQIFGPGAWLEDGPEY